MQKVSKQKDIVVKVGLIGDVETGKTSLMVKYVEGFFDEDYIETLGKFFHCARGKILTYIVRSQLYGEDDFVKKR